MNVAPLSPADVDRVAAFFDRIPEGDRTFFKEQVAGAATVQRWLADGSTAITTSKAWSLSLIAPIGSRSFPAPT